MRLRESSLLLAASRGCLLKQMTFLEDRKKFKQKDNLLSMNADDKTLIPSIYFFWPQIRKG